MPRPEVTDVRASEGYQRADEAGVRIHQEPPWKTQVTVAREGDGMPAESSLGS
jgi:hypothetical protein